MTCVLQFLAEPVDEVDFGATAHSVRWEKPEWLDDALGRTDLIGGLATSKRIRDAR